MRLILAATLLAVSLSAAAQSGARPRPPGTVPLEDVPPPPAMVPGDSSMDPVVTTRTEGDQEVQEYRVKGKLFMQRVKPKGGKEYVLMDHQGNGTFVRQDNPLDNGVRVPQWVLLEF
ncbi:MAG TPA: DUF2782 domain-containing protein [Steroidobacteraceae bacterium]|jgi:hypothetical protein|nr:DUF2782 domain-containing protein [Steroidobacteraceae bacterium]